MSDDRRLAVLRAIVEDYIATEEPVGSKALADRHSLGVSPATVRNDMAVLEDEGYLTQPHTSAGRIPTDKGYRLFVDQLSQVRPLTAAERRAITTFLQGAVDLDDVVHRSVRLLSQLTGQVAVMQYPSLQQSSVRHVEVVLLPPSRLILVVIADTGRVEQRLVELAVPVDETDVVELRSALNARLDGQRLSAASSALADLSALLPVHLQPALSGVLQTLMEMLVEQSEERVVLGGTANLTRSATDFGLTLRPVLEALEEHVVLLKLIGEANHPSVVHVRIGNEHTYEGLRTTSVVTSGYGLGETSLAGLGVLGPTRMDYPAAMTHVRAVARYVGQLLAEA